MRVLSGRLYSVETVAVVRWSPDGSVDVYSTCPEHRVRLLDMAARATKRPRGKPAKSYGRWIQGHQPTAGELDFLLSPPDMPDAQPEQLLLPVWLRQLVAADAAQRRAWAAGVDEDLVARVHSAAGYYVALERHCIRHGAPPTARESTRFPGSAPSAGITPEQAADKVRLRGWLPARDPQAWDDMAPRLVQQAIVEDWDAAARASAAGTPPIFADHPMGDPALDGLI